MSLTEFVNGLFDRLFFGGDKAAGIAAFENEIASDAVFEWVEHDVAPQRQNRVQHGVLRGHRELPRHQQSEIEQHPGSGVLPSGSGGVVAQVSKFTVTTGGSTKEQSTVRIVKVEERGGKKVMTSLVEVQA
ncbi:hypothetical protein B0H17DRAFT_1185724 [Mycena rosella]|uniref:Uncharacterized protein n=1 Tax=Mycena rosella TaxID=1033263 RepID=A0AAD7CQE4_MYCRO|nr:hypothetical protein B0H17DRAFT_1185724 [Mycena rosella]